MPQRTPSAGCLNLTVALIWLLLIFLDVYTGKPWWLLLLHIILVLINLHLAERNFGIIAYFKEQAYLRQLARLRTARYNLFRLSVKAGAIEDFETEAKQVIK
jgi:hypothetical protein